MPLWTQGKEEEEVEEEQLLAQEHRGGGGKRLSLDTGALFRRARALKKEEREEEVVGEKILAGEGTLETSFSFLPLFPVCQCRVQARVCA